MFTLYRNKGDKIDFYGSESKLNPIVINRLYKFQELWGAPVVVSKHPEAIYRRDNSNSQHNINKYTKSNAVDVFPSGLNKQRAKEAYNKAVQAGFKGIGIYSDTSDYMMHLDVRNTRRVASWSRNFGVYQTYDSVV